MGQWLSGAGPATQASQTASQLRIQTALGGQPIPIGWGQQRLAPNLIWYGDFDNQATQGGGGGGGKGGLFSSNTQVNYSASSILALCEGPIVAVNGVFNSSGFTSTSGKGGKNSTTVLPNAAGEIPLAAMGYTLFLGDYSQEPWSYLTSAHPDQALAYRGTAYVCQANQFLGTSPELPAINLDVVFGMNSGAAAPNPDCNPADVIIDFLTNTFYGVPGWPANLIGDPGTSRTEDNFSSDLLSTYWNYCQANGLWVSPVISDSRTASDFISELLKFSNSEAIFTQGALKIVPYGDQSASANGGSYTAPSQQLYDVADDDLVSKDPDRCVEITRLDVTQQLNDIRVVYFNRAFQYNPDVPMEAMDPAAIAAYGRRPNQIEQFDFVCLPGAAQACAQLMLQRQKIVSTYKLAVGQHLIWLDPMDIVALYVPQQGLVGDGTDGQWVRIKEIQENSDYTLTITAEVYLDGTGSAPEFGTQPNEGAAPNFGVQPGNVNAPIFWEPTLELSDAMEVWCAISGQQTSDWGGCQVWVSTDNTTYAQVPGLQIGPARMGVLAAALPTFPGGEDAIDTTDTLAVNLTESAGQMLSGSDSDAQALATLCFVDGEYIAYAGASAFGASEYNLTYLVRGAYGTAAVMNAQEHPPGANFARIDSQIFKVPYNQSQIGQTIYLKFLSFNLVGAQLQTLSEVEPYTYTIVGLAGGITTLEEFAAEGVVANGANGGQIPAIQCTWTPIENAAVISVVFEYYVQGGDPSQSTQVTCSTPAAGIFLILAGLQPATTYEIRATITTAPDNLLPSDWTPYIAVTTPNTLVIVSNSPPNVPGGLTLTNVAKVQNDGTIIAGIAAGWSAVSSVNIAYYNSEWSFDGGATWKSIITPATSYEWDNLVVGTFVEVRIASVSNLGAQSAFSTTQTITVTGQSAAPSAPSALVATPGFQTILLQWVNPTNPDFDFVQVWCSTTDLLSTAANIGDISASSFADAGLAANTQYYYWIRAVNSSGLQSAFNSPANSGTPAKTLQVGTTDITPNSITSLLIAAGAVIADTIGAGQVTANAMAAGSITAGNAALATASVGTANIQSLAVGTLEIAGNAVTVPAIATGNVTLTPNAAVAVVTLTLNVLGLAGQTVTIFVSGKVSPVADTDVIAAEIAIQGPGFGFTQIGSDATVLVSNTFYGNHQPQMQGYYTYTATGAVETFQIEVAAETADTTGVNGQIYAVALLR